MFKIFSTIILILVIVFFPPSILAFVSNDAAPGDSTYLIKRKLEDGIVLIASVHPTTKAMFSLARNGRRFKETVKVLDTKRSQKEVTETLTGLVQQSYDTAQEIKTVKDPVRKKELTVKLKNTLKEYRSVLKQYEESSSSPQSGSTFVTPSDNRNQQNQNRDQVNEGRAGTQEDPTPGSTADSTVRFTPNPTPHNTVTSSPRPVATAISLPRPRGTPPTVTSPRMTPVPTVTSPRMTPVPTVAAVTEIPVVIPIPIPTPVPTSPPVSPTSPSGGGNDPGGNSNPCPQGRRPSQINTPGEAYKCIESIDVGVVANSAVVPQQRNQTSALADQSLNTNEAGFTASNDVSLSSKPDSLGSLLGPLIDPAPTPALTPSPVPDSTPPISLAQKFGLATPEPLDCSQPSRIFSSSSSAGPLTAQGTVNYILTPACPKENQPFTVVIKGRSESTPDVALMLNNQTYWASSGGGGDGTEWAFTKPSAKYSIKLVAGCDYGKDKSDPKGGPGPDCSQNPVFYNLIIIDVVP